MPARPTIDADADRLRTIERLIADVAHDMRTPLQALLMNIEVARLGASPETTGAALDALDQESRRLSALVDALTAVLRSPSEMAETFEIDQPLERIAPLLRAGTRTRHVLRAIGRAGDGVLARAPLDTLCYAVARLVLALRDALPDGAVLTLDAHAAPDQIEIRISGRPRIGARVSPDYLDAAVTALAPSLEAAGGTIAIRAGSTIGAGIGVRLVAARAGHRLTGDSASG
ncbi:MAG: hypothetical protein L0271_26600 [Gemmatimonadetes bacterium]|nr:hypothetical protein [Gemmatimonadota bacterium]